MIELILIADLILLQMLDGRAVMVNPKQITQLSEAREAGDPNKLTTDEVDCLVRLTDGTFVSVTTPCEEIRALIEGK